MHGCGGTHLDHSDILFAFQMPMFHIFWETCSHSLWVSALFSISGNADPYVLWSSKPSGFTVLLDSFKFLSTLVCVQGSCFNQPVMHDHEPVMFQGDGEMCLLGSAYLGWVCLDSSWGIEWTPLHLQGS